jgi:hypothetical protein
MANRQFRDSSFTIVNREVRLYCAVSVGAAGAVTLQKWNYPTLGTGPNARTYTAAPTTAAGQGYPTMYQNGAEGVRSVTRTGTGLWTLQLQDTYQRVLGVNFNVQKAGGLSTIMAVGINSTLTSLSASGGATIGLALLSATATAADPASGDLVLLSIRLQDATEP